jgi:asparagine synthase (glutamine-hydrolysing)
MALFAGAYSLDRQGTLDQLLARRLRGAISRDPRNEVREFAWPSAYLVHADTGALGYPSLVERPTGAVAAVAGQLLSDHRPAADRRHEVERLAVDLLRGSRESLAVARGTFCAVAYDPGPHRLVLAVDRLGVRPIYCWTDRRVVVFSTALRVFESLASSLGIEMDVRGTAQVCVFGFPLGDRTPLSGVRCLRSAEVADFFDSREHRSAWYRWDRVPERPDAGEASLEDLRTVFMDAVRLRLGGDRVARSFLSGGLDSRCIVSGLVDSGATVQTYNFSPPGAYDRVLAAEFARRVGSVHTEVSTSYGGGGQLFSRLIAETLSGSTPALGQPPERPQVVWSGDGGSVGLGRVYLDESMVGLRRNGTGGEAAAAFLRANPVSLPVRMMQPAFRSRMGEVPARGIAEELARLDCADRGKDLLVFLLENDQRRHLATHFENVDLTRLELMLPFFDSEFLSASVSFPLDATLGHRLYNRWATHFSAAVAAVPWQSYPGHEPSPQPLPPGFENQWTQGTKRRRQTTRLGETLARGTALVSPRFPAAIFSRLRVFAALCRGLWDLDRSTYAFDAVRVFSRYYAVCRRRVSWKDEPPDDRRP